MPRRVAVKILHPQHAENPTVRARFKRELEAACRVSHENVVSVYDIGEDPNLGLYYVMELVRGTPLKDYLTGEPLPWPFVYRVGYQLSRALHAIHAAGIVHRDLKPQNIMLVERSSLDELVKVLDFGIASLKTQDEETADVELTGARMVLGTPPYMSPEQTYMRSDRERLALEVDARSDVYSLGVILYEMAAGRRPFSGDAHDIVVAHRLTRPMPLERMVGVSVPKEFAELVMRCLAKDPRERPQSAKDVAQVLKDCEALPVRRWTDVDEPPVDPRELATQMMEIEPLPLLEPLPPAQSTEPRLKVVDLPQRQGPLWAPLAALAGLLAMALFLVLAGQDPPAPDLPQDGPATALASAAPPVGASTELAPAGAAGTATPGAGALATTAAPSADAGGAAEVASALALATGPPPTDAAPSADTTAVSASAADTQPSAPPPAGEEASPMVNLMVTTTPPGATVSLAGKVLGETPVNLRFDASPSRKLELVLTHKKHRDQTVTLALGPELAGKVIVVNESLKPRWGGGPGASGAPGGNPPGDDPFKDL